MMTILSLENLAAAPAQFFEPISLAVLYEDFATGLRAKSLLDRLALCLNETAPCRIDWYRLDVLGEPALLKQAGEKFSAAKLVLFSAHGSRPRDEQLERWLHWRFHRPGSVSRALVVSLDSEARESLAGQRTMLRFRVIAAKAGMTLFPHYEDAPEPARLPDLLRRAWKPRAWSAGRAAMRLAAG